MYCRIGLERFADITHLLNILYLGLGASALCFVTWNLAVKVLGAVRTSVYIYMVPVITVATSVLILKEPVTWVSVIGTKQGRRYGFTPYAAFFALVNVFSVMSSHYLQMSRYNTPTSFL